jgi:hypothetical protein
LSAERVPVDDAGLIAQKEILTAWVEGVVKGAAATEESGRGGAEA